jgi:signal transduction histidine kinase/FixJ family two-component response regulator
MQGTPAISKAPPHESSRSALDFVHRLLTASSTDLADLTGLLGELAAAFSAPAAGLVTLPEGTVLGIHPAPAAPALGETSSPLREQPDLLDRLQHTRTALTVPLPTGGSRLASALGSPERGGWILWVEDPGRAEWTEGETAALWLAGQTLTRRLTDDEKLPRWAVQLDRGVRQERLEGAARLVGRLAHDFGNVLTGILGFSELALSQAVAPDTPLHAYLTEVYRAAQHGGQYINRLRLFARRQASGNRSCNPAAILAEEETRLRPTLGNNVRLRLEVADDLPAATLEAEQLRQVLAILLENAREAIADAGSITVSARPVQLSAAEARDLFGSARAGAHLEITIADDGTGLTPEAERQLFGEAFFSSKPRKRGFGLASAYGLLTANQGGIELVRRSERGTIARVVVPVAAAPAPTAPRPAAPARPAGSRGDKILVVDDDPMILQFVTRTLERAGYRVESAGNAEDALRSYTAAGDDPFRLVLTDVLMPNVNGVDLAKRLLAHDAQVRILFMSGQVPAEFTQQAFAPGQFDLLPKPFRPEGLARAVRASLDRALPLQARSSKVEAPKEIFHT